MTFHASDGRGRLFFRHPEPVVEHGRMSIDSRVAYANSRGTVSWIIRSFRKGDRVVERCRAYGIANQGEP